MVTKPKTMAMFFVLWSSLVLFGFHHRSFESTLRYTRVAEGNISKVVHGIWVGGIQNYVEVLKDDAHVWGRIRPFHWLYYNVPFLITLLRNGDLFRHDPNVRLADRINGDLQTHVLFLISSLSIVTGSTGWLIWRICGNSWPGALFPFFIGSSYILNENLIVYHCDSGEIGQLLLIWLYLSGIGASFKGKIPKLSHEIIAVVFLFLSFAMKETTVVLFPVIFIVLVIQEIPAIYGIK